MAVDVKHKPWMKQPGEVVDKRGVPVYPGDLIRSPHFKDRRGRQYWLYHVAVYRDGALFLVPTSHLEPTQVKGGGSCLLSQDLLRDARVIDGHGPGDCLDYTDRPRRVVPDLPLIDAGD